MKEVRKRINQSIPGALILSGAVYGFTLAQHGDAQPSGQIAEVNLNRKERFIAAADWFVDKNPEFLWPFESMPTAPYKSVRLIIVAMPWVTPSGHNAQDYEPLVAARHLKINGRLQKPDRVIRAVNNQMEQQEFIVRLEQGRLRLTFILPSGATIDSRRAKVKVKLYKV